MSYGGYGQSGYGASGGMGGALGPISPLRRYARRFGGWGQGLRLPRLPQPRYPRPGDRPVHALDQNAVAPKAAPEIPEIANREYYQTPSEQFNPGPNAAELLQPREVSAGSGLSMTDLGGIHPLLRTALMRRLLGRLQEGMQVGFGEKLRRPSQEFYI